MFKNFETRIEKIFIFVMKWLLDLENIETEITEQSLQQMLASKLSREFAGLIPLNSYLQKKYPNLY